MKPVGDVRAILAMAVCALAISGCGQKGDPLPPLVRLPSAPADVVAERRAASVELRFTVPNGNSDGTRPADIQRVEVYALTGSPDAADVDIARQGTRIGSLAVKAPRDPENTIGPGDADADLEPLVGAGIDQGAAARITDNISSLLSSPDGAVDRSYVVVGVSTKGRRGLLSKPVRVPLTPAPESPAKPSVVYDATSITVTWPPLTEPTGQAPFSYHVYEVSSASAAGASPVRMTPSPIGEARFVDSRIEWGADRCYEVGAVASRDGLAVEGPASASTCVHLTDTFPPAAPQGFVAVQSEGAVNLSWDPADASDLAGYIVLRAEAGTSPLAAITPAPIAETTFRDTPRPGVRYVYAVEAVDRSGNVSAPSAQMEATAR